jgi:carboxypeptidase C (cathepsin A)
MLPKIFILSILLFSVISRSSKEDEVKIPLFDDLYKGPMYSGMLDTNNPNRQLHYIFLPSQNNPETDPVVLWLNGGPGCSSLIGFIKEHGPVVIEDYTKSLKPNEWSWNKVANMIYLESPGGVGFSVNDDPKDKYYDDKTTSMENKHAIMDFFNRYPEFRKNEFYISGESYAGVYVPTLAAALLGEKGINLKGIMVGNGVTDRHFDNSESIIDFTWEHALYSQEIRSQYETHCLPRTSTTVSHECNEARTKIKHEIDGLNVYDIYRQCPPKPKTENSPKDYQYQATYNTLHNMTKLATFSTFSALAFLTFEDGKEEEPVGVWPQGCKEDPYPLEFLNDPINKAKLNVRQDLTWETCNDEINDTYKSGDSIQIYKDVLFGADLRVWFYSGDTDAAVPINGSMKWVSNLGLRITEEYRKWLIRDQVAGYVQEYEGFTFATVKGTGHMVPQWKKEEAFILFSAFLKGEKLPA